MRVLRVDSGEAYYVDDEVVEDVLFNIHVNGSPLSQMMAYEQYLEELAIGHLVTSNIIHSLDEVFEVKIDGNTADVQLEHGVDLELISEQKRTILEQASLDEEILLRVQLGLLAALGVIGRAVRELHDALVADADALAAVVAGVAGFRRNA